MPVILMARRMARCYLGAAAGATNDALTPLLYGSAGNLVTAFFDHQGRRAILDGGFTRLYINWDTAGTARYVKNAAAWLVNYERFGNSVVADKYRKEIATER